MKKFEECTHIVDQNGSFNTTKCKYCCAIFVDSKWVNPEKYILYGHGHYIDVQEDGSYKSGGAVFNHGILEKIHPDHNGEIHIAYYIVVKKGQLK